jgi:C4-dicarboxylate-specific signal transduction histidine kinase
VPAILRDIIAQSKRASGLLERFRNWSRPRREAPEPTDLRETLRNVQSLLATQAARQHIALTVSLPQEPASVLADPVEMEQVVFNLVRNAFEALDGMADRRVEVVLERNQQTCILDVSDNGPGVPPGLRDTIFAPFVTGRADGTGLGLALCQRLVERAGGEIFLAEAAGRLPGATFRVVLPSATQPVRRT